MPTTTVGGVVSRLSAPLKKGGNAIRVSPLLVEAGRAEVSEVLEKLGTSPAGLTEAEAEERRETHGPNEVAQETQHGWPWRLMLALRNPLVILLGALAVVSYATGDARAGTVMCLMVVLGVLLKFIQENRAGSRRRANERIEVGALGLPLKARRR